ncbi:hypothetical protein RclHR1_12160012 [Rhizophagus clarus]|uniref:Uncharacterized protein n=1 Tax=Rhizophagus clarus TaxID=94130 RepID=A0A2Z6Q6E2_9GLOM|nr:hypothetical protein RclHR1_12160012 [Rhizophagus clarus]GES85613.1 hypothetical protein GLOIN_2v1869068 [Rhizophagus clarus]
MVQPSIYSDIQYVNIFSQPHKWTDANVISSHKEDCKQLDICQEKLREENEQKGQEKLGKNSSHSIQLSQKVACKRDNNVAAMVNIGNIRCVRKGNKW